MRARPVISDNLFTNGATASVRVRLPIPQPIAWFCALVTGCVSVVNTAVCYGGHDWPVPSGMRLAEKQP